MLGREVMDVLEKVTTSPAWGTVSAVNKGRLADAIASGNAQNIIDLASRIGARAAAASVEEEEGQQPPSRHAPAGAGQVAEKAATAA